MPVGVITAMLEDESKVKEANDSIILELQDTTQESKGEFLHLRRKLTITYWVIIILSIVMFVLGLVLISVPIVAVFTGDIDRLQSIISAGFGIADLAALFLYGPIEMIHKIMGYMSQLILVLNS